MFFSSVCLHWFLRFFFCRRLCAFRFRFECVSKEWFLPFREVGVLCLHVSKSKLENKLHKWIFTVDGLCTNIFLLAVIAASCVCKAAKVKPCTTRSENCDDDDGGGGWERIFKLRTFCCENAISASVRTWRVKCIRITLMKWLRGWRANGKWKMNEFYGLVFPHRNASQFDFQFCENMCMQKLDDLQSQCQRTATDPQWQIQ